MRILIVLLMLIVKGEFAVAEASLPWRAEIPLSTPGEHVVRIDDRELHFRIPQESPDAAGRNQGIVTRGEEIERRMNKRPALQEMTAFYMGWQFTSILSLWAGGDVTITAKVHLMGTPRPAFSTTGPSGRWVNIPRQPDYTQPDQFLEWIERTKTYNLSSPREVIINGRKWYHQMGHGWPAIATFWERYSTGIAPDRYLTVSVEWHPVQLGPDHAPRYPPEELQPAWFKRAVRLKDEVISSLRISMAESGEAPDHYEVMESKGDR